MRSSVIKIRGVIAILSLSVLFFDTSEAQSIYPISPRLDSMRLAVYSQLGINTTGSRGVPAATVNRALNRGLSQTCIDYPAIEALDTLFLQRDSEGVALADDFLRLKAVFRIIGDDSLRLPIRILNVDQIQAEFPTTALNIDKKPDRSSPAACFTYQGRLFPQPKYLGTTDAVDTLLIHYFAMGNPLLADDSAAIVLPEYVEKIIQYACAEVSATRQNFSDASYYLQRYQMGLAPRKPREAELKQ